MRSDSANVTRDLRQIYIFDERVFVVMNGGVEIGWDDSTAITVAQIERRDGLPPSIWRHQSHAYRFKKVERGFTDNSQRSRRMSVIEEKDYNTNI